MRKVFFSKPPKIDADPIFKPYSILRWFLILIPEKWNMPNVHIYLKYKKNFRSSFRAIKSCSSFKVVNGEKNVQVFKCSSYRVFEFLRVHCIYFFLLTQ